MDADEALTQIKQHLQRTRGAVLEIRDVSIAGVWTTRMLQIRSRSGEGVPIDIFIENESIAVSIGDGASFEVFDEPNDLETILRAVTQPIDLGFTVHPGWWHRRPARSWPPYGS